MATQPSLPVTSGGKERVERIVQALTPVFRGDPLYTWFMYTFDIAKHDSVRQILFRAFFMQCALNNGLIWEVGDYKSCGLFMPPGAKSENPWTMLQAGLLPMLWNIGFSSLKRAMLEFTPASEHIKKREFSKEEQKNHWYIFIMGTSVDFRQQGLGTALIRHVQEQAKSDKCPIWLEATTETSRNLYLKHGFVDHGEFILGKGKVGRDGLPKRGGEGIIIWSMSWRP